MFLLQLIVKGLGMDWAKEKEKMAADITKRLYKEGFVETIFNTPDEYFRKNGWTLKSGIWSRYIIVIGIFLLQLQKG